MVGKIKHVRQKLHQEAVRPGSGLALASSLTELTAVSAPILRQQQHNNRRDAQAPAESCFPSGIFAGTKITPDALRQSLQFEEKAPHVPAAAEKEMSSIKQLKEQQLAAARRQQTPVVGDMQPLADALPELCQLIAPVAAGNTPSARRKSRKNRVPVKRPEPTDFSQMKQSQKRKLLETESARFGSAVKTLSAKMNPLADIGEQLRKKMREEEEHANG
ncbi:protein FAM207A isoform X2 [Sander lucioperca]|uniref:protein FAM207A isoform X2 n=1 Tax=Sander lucioperca TaxID=283035 RepID=UPI00125D7BFA|nr:protein FAM207A isoform X2 [Sander lucioperca]